jgi:hypothetical protein
VVYPPTVDKQDAEPEVVFRGDADGRRKRARRSVEYAKYGLLSGSIEEVKKGFVGLSCGILAHGRWPSWSLVLKVKNMDLKWIMGLRLDLHETLRELFPNAQLLSQNIVDSVFKSYPVTLVLCERRQPIQSSALWNAMPMLRGVLSLKKLQGSVPVGWFSHEAAVRHVDVGGATDGEWTVSAATRSNKEPSLFSVDACPMGNLISCIDQSLMGSRATSPPTRNEAPGVYRHGGFLCAKNGLYPRGGNPQDLFLLPTFRSSTKWCTRKLSAEEIRTVWDVTSNLTTGLRPVDCEELLSCTVPLKILGTLIRNVGDIFEKGRESGDSHHVKRKFAGELEADDSTRGRKEKSARVERDGEIVAAPMSEMEVKDANLKAAKADDAEVPKHIWNDRIDSFLKNRIRRDLLDAALESIRKLGHKWWLHLVIRSFWRWRRGPSIYARQGASLEGGLDAIRRATCSSWWEWDHGSRIHFWRWPEEYLATARDGIKPRFKGKPPRWVKPQRVPTDDRKLQLTREKIQKVRTRGYVAAGKVMALMNVFDVPKGDDDIRLVYDGTKSKLNDHLWAPWFPLPTVESLLRSVGPATWLGDNDIAEQFHNFTLHPGLQPYCGLDLTGLFPEELTALGHATNWERWTRCPMGIKTSPYQAAQGMIWLEELVRGNRHDEKNPVRWANIILNLPGSPVYVPSKPWVYKARLDGAVDCAYESRWLKRY